MSATLPQLLRRLLAQHGRQLVYDARLLKALLADLHEDNVQVGAAVHVVERGLADQLWQFRAGRLPCLVHRRMVSDLEDRTGLKPDVAAWAVFCWAEALGIRIEDQALEDQVELLSFVHDIIREKNDPTIKPENVQDITLMLLGQLNESINTHLIMLLPEKDQLALDKLMDQDATNYELDQFMERKIPNMKAEIASVLLDFRAVYLYPVKHRGG